MGIIDFYSDIFFVPEINTIIRTTNFIFCHSIGLRAFKNKSTLVLYPLLVNTIKNPFPKDIHVFNGKSPATDYEQGNQ